ncbi:MAG: protein kinase domain-containing protein [Blastocatellia bacterium]
MTPERWRAVDELLEAALAHSPDGRAAFLAEACADDTALRQEVESLLRHHEQEDGFLESLPGALAAEVVAGRDEWAGRQFGHYQIERRLGQGGMGVVYLARDTRLGRPVALKLLQSRFTQDPERVRRFRREARAASNLNHPNILTIYEVGQAAPEEGGAHFIAAEFVAGETLRARITSGTRPDEALDWAIQIAAALAAAHEAGVVHRDIKPENVMARPDGLVKVLDFGLAKLSRATSDPHRTASGHSVGETRQGIVLGTVNYMSPEQARGEQVDARTDIFALGVMLYEMVAGRRPFVGPTESHVLVAIQDQEPPPLAPAELQRVVGRALAKLPEERYQTVAEMSADLERLKPELGSAPAHVVDQTIQTGAATTAPRRWFRPLTASIALAALLVTAGALTMWVWPRRAVEVSPWINARATRVTDFRGEELFPSLAPDGASLIYAHRDEAGDFDIYWQRVGSGRAQNLTADFAGDDTHPALSPDGQRIAFRSARDGGGIFVMGASGESARKLAGGDYHHPAWSPDGRQVIFTEEEIGEPTDRGVKPRRLWSAHISSGEKRLISTADIAQPQWSPHGARIAYWGQRPNAQRDIWTMRPDGGDAFAVTDDVATDWNPLWSPDGRYLYFVSDRSGSMNLWRAPVDEQTGKVLGSPELIPAPSAHTQHLSFARDGKRLAYAQATARYAIQRLAFEPNRAAVVGQAETVFEGARIITSAPRVSPDGTRIVFSARDGSDENLFLVKADGSDRPQHLTDDKLIKNRGPVWSPDGRRLAFYSNRSGKFEIWLCNTDGSGARQLTSDPRLPALNPFWRPDGVSMVFTGGNGQPFLLENIAETRAPQRLLAPTEIFWPLDVTADGTKLIGGWALNESQPAFLAVYSLAARQMKTILRLTRADGYTWLNDQRRVVFAIPDGLILADTQTGKTSKLFSVVPNRIIGFSFSRDYRTVYLSLMIAEADVWLLGQ